MFETVQSKSLTLWRGVLNESFSSLKYTVEEFDRAVLSWNGSGEAFFELEIGGVRYAMGRSGDDQCSVKCDSVDVDTLVLKTAARSFCFHVTLQPGAKVSLVAITHWRHGESSAFSNAPSPAWGKCLTVPERSQFTEAIDAGRICSPTSVGMVLAFYGIEKSTREVADGVFDYSAKVYGNWALNTAYAHRVSGLESYVVRTAGFESIESEIEAGRPVVASLRWKIGELEGAAIAESNGHLVAVCGFTSSGDVIVNDPAGQPGTVRRIYKRRAFFSAWIKRAFGIIYVFKRTH